MFFIILMNCCLASGAFFARYALVYMHPFLLVAVRMLSAGIILCASQLIWNPRAYRELPSWKLLMAHGLLTMSLLCLFEAWALQGITITKAHVMWAMQPLFIVLVMRIWMRHPVSLLQKAALALSALAIVCWMMPELLLKVPYALKPYFLLHDLSMIAAVAASACGYMCAAEIAKNQAIILSNGISMCIGGILSLIAAYVAQGDACLSCTNWYASLFHIGCIVILVNIIGLTLQTWLTRKYSVVILALSSSIAPMAGVLLGFLQGDTWNMWLLLATGCVGISLAMLYYDKIMYSGAEQGML